MLLTKIIAHLAAAGVLAATPVQPGPTLSWTDCKDGLSCSTISVPIDWKRPNGPKTTVELTRLPATDPAKKLGTIVFNPGGPGPASLRQISPLVNELRQSYDVVGLDPRGLGEAGHVLCGPWPDPLWGIDSSEAGWQRTAQQNAVFDASCRKAGGAVVDHLNGWQVAHDLEAVRLALGEGKLNYFGNSWGTVYGQAYAELFPRNVHRMYLDSVADHTKVDMFANQLPVAEIVEENLTLFSKWCAATPSCALHGTDVLALWDRLAAKAPLPAGDKPALTADQFRFSTSEAIRGPRGADGAWPQFAASLAKADSGDASALIPQTFRGGRSVVTQSECADVAVYPTVAQIRTLEARLRAVTPRIGWKTVGAYYGICVGLTPAQPYRPHPLHVTGLPPVLLAGGLADTTTPWQRTQAVARQMPGSAFLRAEGGHALYLLGDRCVRDYVNSYFADGTLPPAGKICA